MTAASSVSSNALNFMSAVKNGVDERTGLYTVSINLPEIKTNDLRGPGFALAMAYSPLNTQDSGYGYGWNLQLSEYTLGSRVLSLSTGETFKVTSEGDNGRLVLKEQKLDSFHFYEVERDKLYRVMHKSGLIEILQVQGSQENRVALPVEIYAPTGHRIRLGYETFNGTHHRLEWIKDDSDATLLTIERDSASIKVLMRPFDGPDGGPLALFEMTLDTSDKRVIRITLPTEERASWRFDYRFVRDHLCMTEVETPSGGREEIYYDDEGHRFPVSSGREPLPRVNRHLTKPGYEDQPDLDVRYTYKSAEPNATENNFLGCGLNISWAEDGLDNLYKWINAYEYVCVEALHVDGQAVRTIERRFNQFHLLTRETTTQNKHVRTVETSYYLTPGVSFDAQPKYCQLPKEFRTLWSVVGNPNRRRTEIESKRYDSYGNQLEYTQATGVVETSTWYPASGCDDCPADPEGFVRHVKDRTVTPAASSDGEAPTLRTRHRYKALPALTGTTLPNWITLESQTLMRVVGSAETELERTLYEHDIHENDPFLYGRIKCQKTTLNGKTTIIDYGYEKLISAKLDIPVQRTTETLSTTFDNVKRTVIREHSLLTSQEVLNHIDGVEIHYFYDVLNRLVREVVNSKDFPASREYHYSLSTVHGQQAEQVTINANKVTTRSVMDGLGQVVFQERDHVDSENPTRSEQTYAGVYDAWGNLIEQTDFDWWDGQGLKLKSCFFYDDWAHRYRVVGPDGVETHETVDPIGTDDWRGPIHKSWTQSAGPTPVKSGMSETWMNLFGKPAKVISLGAAEEEYATENYRYDGLGRTTEHRDATQFVTRFSYDAWSRLISTILPDDSIVTQTYADHSSSDLTVALSVNSDGEKDIPVGEREFDGLGRLTRLTTGKRTERYTYKDDQLQIKTRTTPANDSIEYDYNLELTDKPVSCRAPDENVVFSFDPTSARLTRASSEQGKREYHYNAANQLRSERWIDQQDITWETLYASSLQGRQLKRTDLKQAGNEGLDTRYVYDDFGRVKNIGQGQLHVGFEYDNLSQLSRTTTKDLATNSTLVTELKYDHQGREILRTLTLDSQPARILEQIWKVDGLLETRYLQQNGATLLKEKFFYDSRGRLTLHECEGSTLPRDGEGREITRQTWTFDALDNITASRTTFPDDKDERAFYIYSDDDPCQLCSIAYLPARPSGNPTFRYNLNGCQLNDERGHSLTYDSQNRLLRVENTAGQVINKYWYDGHDHLVNSKQGNQSENLHFYQGEQLTTMVQDDRKTQFLSHADQPLGQQQAGDNSQSLLLLTDANHSVIGESQRRELRTAVYSAYGERYSEKPLFSLRAFNGEVREDRGWYLLGRGYRAYNPGLMRFHCPDSLSPFGSGGINPYVYCLGNPIALRDPTGHSSSGWSGRLRLPNEDDTPSRPMGGGSAWLSWVFVAVGAIGTVISAIATVLTAGAALPLTGAAFAFTAAKASVLFVGTALGAASTISSTVGAAGGDQKANELAGYFGLGSLVAGGAAFILGGVAKVVGNGFDDLLLRLKPLSSGTMQGFGPEGYEKILEGGVVGIGGISGIGGIGGTAAGGTGGTAAGATGNAAGGTAGVFTRVLGRFLPRAWFSKGSKPTGVKPQNVPPGKSGSGNAAFGSRDVNWRNKIHEPVKLPDDQPGGGQAGNINTRGN